MGSIQSTTLNNETGIDTIGVASCLGGSRDSCDIAPYVIRSSSFQSILQENNLLLYWQEIVVPDKNIPNSLPCLTRVSQEISSLTHDYLLQNFINNNVSKPFLLISGDHSSAIGTWSGIIQGLAQSRTSEKTLGLIWLDAHLDAHTLETSPSGNLHGMPLSVLLGKADNKLQATYPETGNNFLMGRNLSLLGVRSYEPEELTLLKQSKATIYEMPEILNNSSAEQLLNTIAEDLLSRCDVIGLSLDLDVIDPQDAPAVETPEKGGIRGKNIITMLENFSFHDKLIGFEISEFNPVNDINHKTEQLILQIINALFKNL